MSISEVLRIMLVFTIVGMAALALLYLSRRRLAWPDLVAWVLLALLVPILGPFLTISFRPGLSTSSRANAPGGLPAREENSAGGQRTQLSKSLFKNRRTASQGKTPKN